ncbi:MAG: septal ring lytic transglycosylase RlpA family protein, partial [Bacteroidota bacterium]
VVDLSRLAARQLNFMYDGLTRVTVETIEFIPYVDSVRLPTDIKVIDTITGGRDSVLQADSVVVDSVRADRDTVFGIASFYSSNLDGSKTATGEIYRNHKMSAASNNFKLNTWVRVTNLKNNKSIILRINDRMHKRMQQKGRVVDLSRIAANRLDFIKKGLTSVRVEVVAKGTLE